MEVVELFLRSPFRRFPVLSGTRLVGLISRRDVMRAVLQLW
jgi:CBS domain-containing protein